MYPTNVCRLVNTISCHVAGMGLDGRLTVLIRDWHCVLMWHVVLNAQQWGARRFDCLQTGKQEGVRNYITYPTFWPTRFAIRILPFSSSAHFENNMNTMHFTMCGFEWNTFRIDFLVVVQGPKRDRLHRCDRTFCDIKLQTFAIRSVVRYKMNSELRDVY